MNPFFAYLIKSSISAAILYVLFRLFMRKHNQHAVNRFLLLGIIIFSLIIPSLNIRIFQDAEPITQIQVFREFFTPDFSQNTFQVEPTLSESTPSEVRSVNYIHLIYLLGVLALVIQFVVGIIRVMQILRKAQLHQFQDVIVAIVKEMIQPFSFFNRVVISEIDFTENKDIVVTHEHAHIKLGHVLDLVVCELFTVMHFFNPFVWMLRRDLKLIHEYQADQAVLEKGIDAQKYQLLVLEKAVGKSRFTMASQFTQKPFLKRLQMMKKTKTEKWALVKLILFVPILALLLQAFARPELITTVNELIPVTSPQDSTDIWLSQWTMDNLQNMNRGLEVEQVVLLPPPPPKGAKVSSMKPKQSTSHKKYPPIKAKNVLAIMIKAKNKLLIEGRVPESRAELLMTTRKFLENKSPFGKPENKPEAIEKEFPLIGKAMVNKGVIVISRDLGTDKSFVDSVLKDIGKIYLDMWNSSAVTRFDKKYFELSESQKKVIKQIIPIRLSIEQLHAIKVPPPPVPCKIKLLADGGIQLNKQTIQLADLSTKLAALMNHSKRMEKKYKRKYFIVGQVEADKGVTKDRVLKIKEILEKAGIIDTRIIATD